MTRLAGERATVVRPHAQWQLYERRREWYGRVWDWYTVEGPFVRKHDGRYYCFYSGGAWKEPNYGVSYAVADHPMEPFVSTPGADGPNLLRTRPGQVIGPGHASVVHAPDNAHEYIVYHAWDPQHTKRLMRIDRLDWSVEGPSSPVPTLDPQPALPLLSFNDLFDGPDEAPPNPDTWRVDGETGDSETGSWSSKTPRDRTLLTFSADGTGLLSARERDTQGSSQRTNLKTLGSGFKTDAYHRLLVSSRAGKVEVWVDGVHVASEIEVPTGEASVGLLTYAATAAFAGVSVTLLPKR
jgi:hypothetical protein